MKHAVRASSKKPHLYSNRQLIALMLPPDLRTDFHFLYGNRGFHDGQQCERGSYFRRIPRGFHQYFGDPGLLRPGLRRCHCLCQLSWPETAGSGGTLCQPASVYYFAISLAVLAVCQLFRAPLLRLVFGSVEQEVMDAAMVYFFYTSLSFPFIALFDSGSAVFRAQNNSRLPMAITVSTNLMNIAGNALLIWGFHLGVAGAAVSTLLSRIAAALLVLLFLRRKSGELRIGNFIFLKPDGRLIKKYPADRYSVRRGKNGMFQFGKLAIQSTVSTLGTTAIAAQAMTNIMENFNGIAGIGIGIGMMTVVGQCLGGRQTGRSPLLY